MLRFDHSPVWISWNCLLSIIYWQSCWYNLFVNFLINLDVESSRNSIFEKNIARSERAAKWKSSRISIIFQDHDVHILGTFPLSLFFPHSHSFMEELPLIIVLWSRCGYKCSLKGIYFTSGFYRKPHLHDLHIFWRIIHFCASSWYSLWMQQKHQMLGFDLEINTILESKNNKDILNISFSTEINQLQFRELH